jgi:hypothetical protein
MFRGEGPQAQASIGRNPIAHSEPRVHFYSTEDELLDTLSSYIGEGLRSGESAIVIATPEHLRALRYRLEETDADLIRAMFEDRYITLDAHVGLTSFLVDGVADERMFNEMARTLLRRASVFNRRVRAFGEMVALLWASGNRQATVRLEQFWENFCRAHQVGLLCSYPKALFPAGQIASARRALVEAPAGPSPSI